MNLKPLGDRVVLKQLEAETKTASGLYIPDSAQEKPQQGIVISVGEGKLDANGNMVVPGVKEGDKVLYSKYGGTDVTLDGEDFVVLRADDIYAIIEG